MRPPARTVAVEASHRSRVIRRQAGFPDRSEPGAHRRDVAVGLIDGSVDVGHRSLRAARIVVVGAPAGSSSPAPDARDHATFTASMLVGRGEGVLGLCPDAIVVSVPVVNASMLNGAMAPREVAERIAWGVGAAVSAGADVLHLGLDFESLPGRHATPLLDSLRRALARGVRAVLAAGNAGGPVESATLRAPGVVPVALGGRAVALHPRTAWGPVMGHGGLTAPGVDIPGAVAGGGYVLRSGSSFAAAFVSAGYALLRAAGHDGGEAWSALLCREGRSLLAPSLDVQAAGTRLTNVEREVPR